MKKKLMNKNDEQKKKKKKMVDKNTPRYPAIFIYRIAISVHKCYSSDLIFKIIIEMQIQGNRTTILKVVSKIGMTLFSEAVTRAVL